MFLAFEAWLRLCQDGICMSSLGVPAALRQRLQSTNMSQGSGHHNPQQSLRRCQTAHLSTGALSCGLLGTCHGCEFACCHGVFAECGLALLALKTHSTILLKYSSNPSTPLAFLHNPFRSYIANSRTESCQSQQQTPCEQATRRTQEPTKSRCLDVAREARDSVCHCTFELTLPRCQRKLKLQLCTALLALQLLFFHLLDSCHRKCQIAVLTSLILILQAREVPSATERCLGTTSKESPSLLSAGWPAVVV